MARRRSANNPSTSEVLAAGRKQEEPDYENQSQEAEAEGAQAARDIVAADSERQASFKLDSANGQPSKADMVRAGLADGLTKPGDLQDFIRSRYGVEIPKQMVSSYSAQERARQRKKDGIEPTPRGSAHSGQHTAIPTDFPADIKRIKALIEKAGGADELRELTGDISMLVAKYGAGGLDSLIEAFE